MTKKTKLFLTVLLVFMLVVTLALFVACNKDGDESQEEETTSETVEATEGLLIDNSDFKQSSVASGVYSKYPMTPASWTGATMYSSGSYPKDVIAGTVNLAEDNYTKYQSSWDAIEDVDKAALKAKLAEKYSTAEGAVNNVLMVYMPKDTDDDDDDDSDSSVPNYGPTAYGFTSNSFYIKAGQYYVLSVDVLTYNLGATTSTDAKDPNPGARIYVASQDYVEYKGIDTGSAWKTYKIYFKGHEANEKTFTVLLGLGNASSTDSVNGLTSGYAFFANVSLTEVKDIEGGKTAAEQYADAVAQEATDDSVTKTSDLNTPNSNFDFGTTTVSSSAVPSLWTMVTGESGNSDKAAPTAAERYNAVIDLTTWTTRYKDYAGTLYEKGTDSGNISYNPAERAFKDINYEQVIYSDAYKTTHLGSKVYMLSQQLMTAQGIKTSSSITVKKNTCYTISIDVLTYQIAGAGVTLELDGSTKLKITGISKKDRWNGTEEDGEYGSLTTWTTYTFYIQGNQYEDKSYTLTLWLGTDGTDKNTSYEYDKYSASSSSKATTYHSNGTFATGWAFFDSFKMNEISAADFDAAKTTHGEATEVDGDTATVIVKSLYADNLFDIAGSYVTGQTTISSNFTTNAATTGTYAGIDDGTLGTPAGFVTDLADEDQETLPIINVATMKAGSVATTDDAVFTALGIKNPGVPYDLNDNILMIYSQDPSFYQYETSVFKISPNNFYRVSLWVKTEGIQSTSGAYVYLLQKDDDGDFNTASSFTAINTETTEDDVTTSEWKELTFVIRGGYNDVEECKLKITFGTGTRWTSSTLASGALFVANPNMASMTYKEYSNSTSGTYLKSVSFVSGEKATFTNGTFNEFDMEETEFPANGKLADSDKIGTPASWTKTDSTTTAKLGTIQLAANDNPTSLADTYTHSTQTEALFGATLNPLFDAIYANATNASAYFGGPNLLAISSDVDAVALGYKSNNFTLSANTNYEISVWVKAITAGTYSVYLISETEGEVTGADETVTYATYFIHTAAGAEDWVEYKFYFTVGQSSVTASIELFLGIDKEHLLAANTEYDDSNNFVKVTDDGVEYTTLTSTGTFLFDNLTIHSKDEAYEAKTAETYRYISYKADSFSPSSTSVDALSTLTYPTNWTGAADGDAKAADTKSGIIYISNNHLQTKALADDKDNGYVSILGADITAEEQTVSTEEAALTLENLVKHLDYFKGSHTATTLDDAKAEFATFFSINNTDDDITAKNIDCYKKEKAAEAQKANWIKLDQLSAYTGNSCLVINNTTESAYKYTSGSSISMSSNKYYKLTIAVRTFGINADQGAYIYLNMNDDDKDATTFAKINTADWKVYEFFVKVQEDAPSSAKLVLGLGVYSDTTEDNTMVEGYAFFDNYTFEEITSAQYEAAVASDTLLSYVVPENPVNASTDEETETEEPETKFNLDNLWWMIPTILLGVAIVAVVIAFFVKKVRKPKKAGDYEGNSITGTRDNSTQVLEKKRNDYDKFKE